MGTTNKPNLNRTGDSPETSKLDLFSGNHTTSLIVGMLIVIVFLGLIMVVCIKDELPEDLITGTIGLLGVLAGFFASNMNKEKK